jgi:hypothetical protein
MVLLPREKFIEKSRAVWRFFRNPSPQFKGKLRKMF